MNVATMLIDLSAPMLRLFDRLGDSWCGPMGGYWGGGMGGFWMIVSILFWMGILAIAALIISKLFTKKGEAKAGGVAQAPIEILDRRYASGEITEKEYRKIKKGLSEK